MNREIDILEDYYDSQFGAYSIPFMDIDASITEAIIVLLRNGYALSCYTDEYEEMNYSLFNLQDSCEGFQEVNVCKDLLKRELASQKSKPFIKVSLATYRDNEVCQTIIDRVLLKCSNSANNVDCYSIALVVEGDYLKFIEVLNAFA